MTLGLAQSEHAVQLLINFCRMVHCDATALVCVCDALCTAEPSAAALESLQQAMSQVSSPYVLAYWHLHTLGGIYWPFSVCERASVHHTDACIFKAPILLSSSKVSKLASLLPLLLS
jgi:hypothetical protein